MGSQSLYQWVAQSVPDKDEHKSLFVSSLAAECEPIPSIDCSGDPFHKHVFLEHHLQSWCPPSGPIRHFMELVCAGLSKNPYMSSAKKVSTITWFQEYFEKEENKEILVHAGYWQEKQAKSAS